MALIDQWHIEQPTYGARKLRRKLKDAGYDIRQKGYPQIYGREWGYMLYIPRQIYLSVNSDILFCHTYYFNLPQQLMNDVLYL